MLFIVKFHLYTVHHSGITAQVTLFIEIVSLDWIGRIAVLIQFHEVACNHIQFVGFKNLRIILVHGDDNVILLFF